MMNNTLTTLRGFKGVIITPFGAKKPLTPLRGVTPLRPLYENNKDQESKHEN